MNCKQAKEHLLDAMTPGTEPAAHVSNCAACAAELAALQSTMALLDEWKAPEASPYFQTRLRARLDEVRREEAAPQGWLAKLRQPSFLRPALVAAMGLAFVIGMNFYQPTSNQNAKVVVAAKGTAVSDLQALEKNEDLYSDFDLLDDIGSNHAPAARQNQNTGSQL